MKLPTFSNYRRLLMSGLLSSLVVVSAYAAGATRSFDLAPGEAAQTLKQFAAQAQREIVFAPDVIGRVKTNPVRGEITPEEALNRLLDGTGLVASHEAKTGVIAVRKGAESPNASTGSEKSSVGVREKADGSIEDGKIVLEVVKVTGTHLRGLLAGATAQPVTVIDAAQIDRTGAQSIGDVLRYIPQVSSFSTGQAATQNATGSTINFSTGSIDYYGNPSHMDQSGGLITGTLRGAPAGATLLLIDGKRAPKSNQLGGRDGFDLNGIPLAAVERIEVLLDGASSTYGADAMGGVINVVLKKYYNGTEVRVGYENTFDTDVSVKTASISHGFGTGKLRGLVTASWEEANEMMMRDRDFLASYDRRPYGGKDGRTSTLPGGAGRISISGAVPLPGLTTTQSAIPAGNTGTGLTVSDYANAGAINDRYDAAQYTQYAAAYDRYAVLGKFDYAFRDWAEFYASMRFSRNRNFQISAPIEALNLSIPAGYPGNPFGVPVTLNKVFLDVQPRRIATDETKAFTMGATGKLPKGWRYDASISFASGDTLLEGDGGTSITSALFNAAVAAGQTPNLFYDASLVRNPNAPGVIEALTTLNRNEEKAQTWTYTAQVDGPVWSLPGGDIVAATGVERREEYADFPRRLATDTSSAQSGNTEVNAYYAEVNVPIVGAKNRRMLLNQLNVSGSYRYEDYSDGGTSKNPRGGIAWRPAPWVLLRGSYGEGSKIPTLQQRTAPLRLTNSSTVATAANLDPLRGNTVNPVYTRIDGGHPALKTETSENTTFGTVIEVPRVKGLSLSFDWFENVYNNRISTLTFNQMVLLYPERITRGANLPTDQPGWAGVVTQADMRPINVSLNEISGYDIGVRYDRDFSWGNVQMGTSATNYTKNVAIATPGGLPSPTITRDSLPMQINGNFFVFRKAWGVGALATYRDSSRETPPNAFTPSAIRWDVQFNYDFAKSAWVKNLGGWGARAIGDTKLSLTVYNVFNEIPPFTYLYLPDNTVLDSRLRRFALSFRRTF